MNEARAAHAAMVEHLGLVEETRERDAYTAASIFPRHLRERRLVQSRWVEVDHVSE